MSPNEILGALLASHGVELVQRGEWWVHESGAGVRAVAEIYSQIGDATTIQLHVDLSLPSGRLITESFAGVGSDVEQAQGDAFSNFATNSLHVLLGGWFERFDPAQVERETWTIGDEAWTVLIGPAGMRGDGHLPDDFGRRLEEAIRATPLTHDEHWFRVYFAQLNEEVLTLECLRDNFPWPAGEKAFADTDWTLQPGYYSLRCFVVLRRQSDKAAKAERPEPSLTQAVQDTAEAILAGYPSDADIFRSLVDRGLDPYTAERLLAFVPIGYSHVLLGIPNLPKHYFEVSESGEKGPLLPLDDERAFRTARNRARFAQKDELDAVARRCAVFKAVLEVAAQEGGLSVEQVAGLELPDLAVCVHRLVPPPAPQPGRKRWRFW